MKIQFTYTKREEYEKIRKELLSTFDFIRVTHNKQAYALGGFNIYPKDYYKGFNETQIDLICNFLIAHNYDDSSLNISLEEVYDSNQGIWTGKKKKHLILRQGMTFLMKKIVQVPMEQTIVKKCNSEPLTQDSFDNAQTKYREKDWGENYGD